MSISLGRRRYVGPELRLELKRDKDQTVLTWTADEVILEEAKALTGPWSEVPAARSLHKIESEPGQKFYRLNCPR